MIKRWIKRILTVGVLVFASVSACLWWAHQQTKKVPEFYQRAISTSRSAPDRSVQSSKRMQARVEKLQADVKQVGLWEAVFAEEQINAWLIEQMPRYFSDLQAKGLKDPQILVRDGNLIAAVQIEGRRFKGVVSCDLSVQMTDRPNCIAITVNSLHVGALPLPLVSFQDRIAKVIAKTSLNLRWETRAGETVALIDIPQNYSGFSAMPVVLEFIELSAGQISLAGRSGESSMIGFEPRGAVYHIAAAEGRSETVDYSIRNVHNEAVSFD